LCGAQFIQLRVFMLKFGPPLRYVLQRLACLRSQKQEIIGSAKAFTGSKLQWFAVASPVHAHLQIPDFSHYHAKSLWNCDARDGP
jgi:hypothetical protein